MRTSSSRTDPAAVPRNREDCVAATAEEGRLPEGSRRAVRSASRQSSLEPMEAVLGGKGGDSKSVRVLSRALQCLGRVGESLVVHAVASEGIVVLHTLSQSQAAFAQISLRKAFFARFEVFGEEMEEGRGVVRCQVNLRNCQLALRNPGSIERLVMRIIPGRNCMKWEIESVSGLKRTLSFAFEEENAAMQGAPEFPDTEDMDFIAIRPKTLIDCVANFHHGVEEISFMLTPEHLAVKTYMDELNQAYLRALHTEYRLEKTEMEQYRVDRAAERLHSSQTEQEFTFCLKEIRAMLAYCDGTDQNFHCYLDQPGLPLILTDKARNPDPESSTNSYTMDMILATLVDQEDEDDRQEALASQQPNSESSRSGSKSYKDIEKTATGTVDGTEEDDLEEEISYKRDHRELGPARKSRRLNG